MAREQALREIEVLRVSFEAEKAEALEEAQQQAQEMHTEANILSRG